MYKRQPNDLAQRELREETGYRAATVTKVGCIDVAPGFVDQVQHVFLMRDLTPGSPEREDTEADIVCRWWPLPKLKKSISAGLINDAQTLAAWSLVQLHVEF